MATPRITYDRRLVNRFVRAYVAARMDPGNERLAARAHAHLDDLGHLLEPDDAPSSCTCRGCWFWSDEGPSAAPSRARD